MKLEVTREVVNDLWPLCQSREASADSCSLVDAFLAEDRDFASKLRASQSLRSVVPGIRLSPDAERRMLDDARERAHTKLLMVGAAVGLGGFMALLALVAAMFLLVGRA